MDDAIRHLAVYGSLALGRSNHRQLAGLTGGWSTGTVRGRLADGGWGAGLGYPAITPDPAAPEVTVALFHSADLPAHWARLDAFEGDDYRREPVEIATADGPVRAFIYAAARPVP